MWCTRIRLILLIVFQLSLSQESSLDVPVCRVCRCDANTTSLECDDDSDISNIFDSKIWLNGPRVHDFATVTIKGSTLSTLDRKFPRLKIELLNLEHNSIQNITVSAFENLQDMATLILSYNQIDIIDPNAFYGQYQEGELMPLRSLKTLKLDNNRIHSLHQDVFEHTDRLEVLFLNNNPLNIVDHQTIVAITSLIYLKKLDLSNTGLFKLPDNFLHPLHFLTYLNLAHNEFEGIPETLGDSNNLTTLIMNGNPIVDLNRENGFPKMATLRVLHMCQMDKLKSVGRHALTGLQQMEILYLAGNDQLSLIDDNAICDQIDDSEEALCPPLKQLYINDNRLTHLGKSVFGRWERLETLDLRENPWSCDCKNQWFVDDLISLYEKMNEEYAKELRCAAPLEMQDYTFYELYVKKAEMRCLDKYGNRPERDAALLVGLLAGVLITIPSILLMIYAYQRKWFGCCESSPAAYSRRFYSRTTSEDNFY